VAVASQCIQAVDALKEALLVAKPKPEHFNNTPIEGDVFGIFSTWRTIRTLNDDPIGAAKLSLGMMRATLCSVYNAHVFSLTGNEKNNIDCVYVSMGYV